MVFVFYPGVEVELFCQPVSEMIDRVETGFFNNAGTKIKQARVLVTFNQQVVFTLEVHVGNAMFMHVLDDIKQYLHVLVLVQRPFHPNGTSLDEFEYQVFVVHQAIAGRYAGKVIAKTLVDFMLVPEHMGVEITHQSFTVGYLDGVFFLPSSNNSVLPW